MEFLKGKKITKDDYVFLRALVSALPVKYHFLLEQISEDFIKDKKIIYPDEAGKYTLYIEPDLESKFVNKKLPYAIYLRDIGVWNNRTASYELVNLHVIEGILASFKVNAKLSDLDLNNISLSSFNEKMSENPDRKKLEKLLGSVDADVLSQLDINSAFEIEIPEGDFYVLKDFEDGNYIGISKSDEGIYAMIHDPYTIEKLFDNKDDFFKAIKDGSFDFSNCWERLYS